jgi:hypothetical protein
VKERRRQMQVFYGLLLAHLLYDFHWQGDFIAQNKSKYPFLLFIHALTWAMFLGVALYICKAFAIWKIAFLFITHFLIDNWKSKLPKTPEYFNAIYIDQGLHLITIIITSFTN